MKFNQIKWRRIYHVHEFSNMLIWARCFFRGHIFEPAGSYNSEVERGYCKRCRENMWRDEFGVSMGLPDIDEAKFCSEGLKRGYQIENNECGNHPVGFQHAKCFKCNFEFKTGQTVVPIPKEEYKFENADKEKQVIEYNRYVDGVKVGNTVLVSYFTPEQVKHIDEVKEKMRQEGKL